MVTYRWRCLCGDAHEGRPHYERQALPSGLMIRACASYCIPGPVDMAGDVARYIEAESKRGAR